MRKCTFGKIAYVCVMALVLSSLSGCSLVPTLTTTDEQTEMVAEYAAGLLVKYNEGHDMGLVPMTSADFVPTPTPVQPTPAPEEEPVVIEDTEPDVDPLVDATSSESAAYSATPISAALGIEGFEIAYASHEICDIYPPEETDELIFSMQASPGTDLLIIHFNLTNPQDAESTCDVASSDVKARVTINGGERIAAQTTILMNDLLEFKDNLAPYGMVDAVMVFEIPEETEVSTLNLIIINSEGEHTYSLV